jgi:hypothetical protein
MILGCGVHVEGSEIGRHALEVKAMATLGKKEK